MEMSLVDSLWFKRHTCQYCPTGQTPYLHGSSITNISNISSSIDTPQQIIPQSIPRFLPPVHQSVLNRIQRPVVALYQLSNRKEDEGDASKNSGDDDDDKARWWWWMYHMMCMWCYDVHGNIFCSKWNIYLATKASKCSYRDINVPIATMRKMVKW